MKPLLLLSLLALISSELSAQFLIENNTAKHKAELNVKSETGFYKMPDGEVCLMWVKQFNEYGLLTQYKDFWQCGQPYWIHDFEYDGSGKCVRSFKSSYKQSFKRFAMKHMFNEVGQLIGRVAIDSAQFPLMEHYNWDSSGNIIEVTFSGPEKNGEKHPWPKTWNGLQTYELKESEEIRDENQELKWTTIRQFEFYERVKK